MNLLARREHSIKELQNKLLARDYAQNEIHKALQILTQEGLQSDERFMESFIHARMGRGSGPTKIKAELRLRGVSDTLVEVCLDERNKTWYQVAEEVRKKKFGSSKPTDFKEKAKQSRFLQYRGFTSDQIRYTLNDDDY
jgi:regulatory protein